MPKFRKKPVVIEAIQIADILDAGVSKEDFSKFPMWFTESENVLIHHDGVDVRTLEGQMRGERDDWLICGVKGELYPCKPDIFEATYEPA